MTIQKLPESVIVRIAAGEVIERPASVVKELVENSVDAGAKRVTVAIENGGLGLIEVADDGSGIPKEELPVALQRHATSKITSANDLSAILTMGFRGEALATIAAAGRLKIVSRCSDGDAWEIRADANDGTTPAEVSPAARERGTTVTVRDLFVKTPARLKFMKSPGAEFSRISSAIERAAIARPDVSFELIKDGRSIFRTPGTDELRATVAELLGFETGRDLQEVVHEAGPRRITGLISPPHITKKNRTGFYLNLNGRPFEDKSLYHAVASAYQNLIPHREFPVVFLTLSLPPAEADVNVHPAKAEVRFRDASAVYRLIIHALRDTLEGGLSLPRLDVSSGRRKMSAGTSELFRSSPGGGEKPVSASPSHQRESTTKLPFSSGAPPQEQNRQLELEEPEELRLRYRGEVAGRYLLAEDNEGLVILDQHAAHERILFDELMSQAQNSEVVAHPLLIPEVLECSASERALVEEHVSHFADIGFEIEIWPDSVALKSVPAILTMANARRVVREVIDVLSSTGEMKDRPLPYEPLARRACKSAVKGTQRLGSEEAGRLLDDLTVTTNPYSCPHGRPTMIRLTLSELDRRFGRG